jgi:methylated-DNA-[protein]-cysteine S-methyltransferase
VSEAGFFLVPTAIGEVAIAWREERVVATSLPEASPSLLRQRLARRLGGAVEREPPPFVAELAEKIVHLLAGEKMDFADAPLELESLPEFERRVYAAALAIPAGSTTTYGALAEEIGAPGAARAVGAALGRNPFPIVIPCHRILAAGGSGGFSAPGGADTKLTLLRIEKAKRPGDSGLFDELPLALAPARSA